MKSLIYILLFVSLFLPYRCDREDWERSCDLTQKLRENENIAGDRDIYRQCTKAPTRILFKDEDDGYFFFPQNPKGYPFKFQEERKRVYKEKRKRVYKVYYSEGRLQQERLIEVSEIDRKTVKVRFFEGSAWIVYETCFLPFP